MPQKHVMLAPLLHFGTISHFLVTLSPFVSLIIASSLGTLAMAFVETDWLPERSVASGLWKLRVWAPSEQGRGKVQAQWAATDVWMAMRTTVAANSVPTSSDKQKARPQDQLGSNCCHVDFSFSQILWGCSFPKNQLLI